MNKLPYEEILKNVLWMIIMDALVPTHRRAGREHSLCVSMRPQKYRGAGPRALQSGSRGPWRQVELFFSSSSFPYLAPFTDHFSWLEYPFDGEIKGVKYATYIFYY